MLSLIASAVGWSKIVFLDSSGNVSLVKEKSGVWDKGAWFSNTTYKTKRYVSTTYFPSTYSSYTATAQQDFGVCECGVKLIFGERWRGVCFACQPFTTADKENELEKSEQERKDAEYRFCEFCGEDLIDADEIEVGCCRGCIEEHYSGDN